MSTYVWRSCPHCNATIEFTRDYRAIDRPYTQCPNCNQLIVLEHQTEWDTKSQFEKLKYLGVQFYTAVLYGMLLPLVYLFITWAMDLPRSNQAFLIVYGIGFLLAGALVIYVFREEVRESWERLEDPQYRKFLRRIGFHVPENEA